MGTMPEVTAGGGGGTFKNMSTESGVSCSSFESLLICSRKKKMFPWSFQQSRGLPRGLFPPVGLIMAWKTRLAFSLRRMFLNHRVLQLLEIAMISESSYLSLSPLFLKILHVLFT